MSKPATRTLKQNWFPTLNDALRAENLIDFWPIGTNIQYGETVSVTLETDRGERYCSVYRDDNGRYERPVHYSVW